jgi:hypothetical protein
MMEVETAIPKYPLVTLFMIIVFIGIRWFINRGPNVRFKTLARFQP